MHSSRMHTSRRNSRLLRGVCLSACWDTSPMCRPGEPPGQTPQLHPGCGPGDNLARPLSFTLGVGLGTPRPRPLNFPSGCGPGDPPSPSQTPQTPPWVLAWRPARHAGIPPPHSGQTDTCKNITFANFICGQ